MSSPQRDSLGRGARFEGAWLSLPLVVGTLLRLRGLERQVLGGDELHAVRIATTKPIGAILTEYSQGSDHSIPLAAFYRAWSDLVGPLSDAVLRLPVLASSLLLLAALPLFAARWFGRWTAFVLASLLAVSPLLVMYGRIVRSYSPMITLGTLALAFFVEWVRDGRARDAWLYALCAASAIWFHLLAAPFVLTPPAVALLGLLVGRGRGTASSARAIAVPLGALAAFLALFLLPCAPSMLEFVSSKSGSGTVELATVLDSLRHLAGTAGSPAAAAFWVLALVGAVVARRGKPRFLAYFGAALAVQVIAVVVSGPDMVELLLVFSRYVVIALPGVCLIVAVALTVPWSEHWSARARWTQRSLALLFVALLCSSGPLVEARFAYGSFLHSNESLEFVLEPAQDERPAPRFHAELAPGGDALIEVPVDYPWRFATAPGRYQREHRREVLVSSEWGLWADARLALRNNLPADPEAFLASRARWVVLYRDPAGEEPALDAVRGARLARQSRVLEASLRRRFGAPDHLDRRVLAWDLERLR